SRALMSYVGLVPREHSSGERERRGALTKAGNAHVRHVLVQAAWSYRHLPRVGQRHDRRTRGTRYRVAAARARIPASRSRLLRTNPLRAAAVSRRLTGV